VPCKAVVERADQEGALRLTGSFSIRQTDFGMTPVSAAGGPVKASDELEFLGDLVRTPARRE
jgi:hypothetical protein